MVMDSEISINMIETVLPGSSTIALLQAEADLPQIMGLYTSHTTHHRCQITIDKTSSR